MCYKHQWYSYSAISSVCYGVSDGQNSTVFRMLFPKISTGQKKLAPTVWHGWHVFATLPNIHLHCSWSSQKMKLERINRSATISNETTHVWAHPRPLALPWVSNFQMDMNIFKANPTPAWLYADDKTMKGTPSKSMLCLSPKWPQRWQH